MKMKPTIGVVSYDFFPIFGGQGRHLYELYKQNQLSQKVVMTIFSPNENNLEDHRAMFLETKKSKLKNIEYSVKINMVIDQLIKTHRLDIIHFHGGPGGLFLFKKVKIPVIYTCHHTYWQQYHFLKSQSWKYFFYLLEKRSYQFADKIICVSKDTKRILEEYYDISSDRLVYIPNGIDHKFKNKKQLHNKKNILYVGRIDKRKGLDFLVETMSLIHNRNKNISLFVVGEGKDKKKLEYYSNKHHLPITFFGHLDDDALHKLYSQVMIQIVPSLFEGFGISVLEGMKQGIPIIGTDVAGIRSIIRDNYSGILVPYANKQALADATITLATNPSLQQKLVINANKELPNYYWKEIYLHTIQTYEKLVS